MSQLITALIVCLTSVFAQSPPRDLPTSTPVILTGRYSVYPLGGISKEQLQSFEMKDDKGSLVVEGQDWKGTGKFDGKRGSYDWSSPALNGTATFEVLAGHDAFAGPILIAHVTGRSVDWWYWARRTNPGTPGLIQRTWKSVSSKEMRIKATYPSDPINKTLETGGKALIAEDHAAAFMTMSQEVKPSPPEMAERLLDAGRDGGLKNVNGTLLAEQSIKIQGYPARFIALKNKDGLIFWDYFVLVDNHLLAQAIAGGYDFDLNREDMQKFLDSFEVLPEQEPSK